MIPDLLLLCDVRATKYHLAIYPQQLATQLLQRPSIIQRHRKDQQWAVHLEILAPVVISFLGALNREAQGHQRRHHPNRPRTKSDEKDAEDNAPELGAGGVRRAE